MSSKLELAQFCKISNSKQRLEVLKQVDISYSLPHEEQAEPRSRHEYAGYTYLHFAVKKKDVEGTNELLNRGADLFQQGFYDGFTPVHIAFDDSSCKSSLKWYKDEMVNTLLTAHIRSGRTFNPTCKKNRISHLHIACIFNHAEAVKFLVQAVGSIHQATSRDAQWLPGFTPLHFAVRYSSAEAAAVLLEHGADIFAKDAKGTGPLHLLIQRLLAVTDYLVMGRAYFCQPYETDIQYIGSIIMSVLSTRKTDDDFLDDESGFTKFHMACTLKDPSFAKYFLQQNLDINLQVNSNSKLCPGWTALHFAACLNIEMVLLLIESGANILIENSRGETALNLCAQRFTPADIQLILSAENKFKDIVLLDNCTKLSDLLIAMNHCDKFSDFLQKMIDVNTVLPLNSSIWPGYNLLHLSVFISEKTKPVSYLWTDGRRDESSVIIAEYYNHGEQMKRLDLCLKHGCHVDTKNANGQTPIHLAFSINSEPTVKKLLSSSRDNVVDQNGLSHLHIACVVGHLDAVKRYLSEGADVNSRVSSSFDWHDGTPWNVRANSTPLHLAVTFNHEDVAKYLLANNADVYAQDSLGFTPIHLTISTHSEHHNRRRHLLARLLLETTPNLLDSVGPAGLSHLHVAAWRGADEAVKKLLLNGAEVDRVVEAEVESRPWGVRYAGKTALHLANSKEVVDSLLSAGANWRAKDLEGVSALQRALRDVSLASAAVVRMAKAGECDVESCGVTALHLACVVADLEWAELLLENGADVNARISDDGHELHGATPLYVLFKESELWWDEQGILDFVKLLLDSGADVTIDCRGRTPVHLIYKNASTLHVIELLLRSQKSYKVNPIDHHSNDYALSHFHFACVRNDVETATMFLDHGVDVNESVDHSFYHFYDPHVDVCCDHEIDIRDFTPLHFAMAHRSREVAYLLLERGADVHTEDFYGNKPLHIAIKRKFVDLRLIETMLGLGADIHVKNLRDETPFHCLLKKDDLTLQKLEFFLDRGCAIDILDAAGRLNDWVEDWVVESAMCSAEPTELQLILERLLQVDQMKNAIQNGFNFIQSIAKMYNYDRFKLDDYLNAIQMFINNGCDLDQQDEEGRTALETAVIENNLQVVNALLLLGADINVANNKNRRLHFDNGIRVKTALVCHLWKMRFTKLEMNESNLQYLQNAEIRFPTLLGQTCEDELKKAKETEICESLTVKDFLSELGAVAEYPRMCPFQRSKVDKYFRRDVDLRREFPEFCGLLALQYRKALARMELWHPAKEGILLICKIDIDDLCLEAILRYFTNSELKYFVELVKELFEYLNL